MKQKEPEKKVRNLLADELVQAVILLLFCVVIKLQIIMYFVAFDPLPPSPVYHSRDKVPFYKDPTHIALLHSTCLPHIYMHTLSRDHVVT